jgi:2,3-bisphosphoglycerate-independent phosphoglycerate mutase
MKDIDQKVLKPTIEYLRSTGEDFRVLIVPDHRTPLAIRTHSSDPVPYVIYDSRTETEADTAKQFNEKSGQTGQYFDSGYELADYFFEK